MGGSLAEASDTLPAMRRDKVLRFVVTAFAVGAFIGLICGLAFGGSDNPTTARAASQDSSTTTSVKSPDETTAPGEPMTAERAQAIGANELGQILVVMYHLIDTEEGTWTRTPQNFRNDLATLKAEGYYPINIRDLASGNIDIPAGKSPVVITFDDSSPGQYRILDDGTIDPDCAVGIMQAAVEAGGWASRATFFPLLDVVPKERVIFGQEDKKQEKLVNLVHWGYEIGSHTITHLDLKKASTKDVTLQLAQSQATLDELIGGGYKVTSLSVPFGSYPSSLDIIKSGTYQGENEEIKYSYTAAVSINGVPCASPFSKKFDAYHIPRVRGSEPYLTDALQKFQDNPQLRYVSDGDPTTVSAPKNVDSALGDFLEDLGRPVVRY
jgi:peptidoglycan/xylan/chitin deacetylase (PgdA/CDA1 family)